MKRAHVAVAAAAVLIGLVHVGGTFVFYEELDADALWFLAAGLFVISAGVLNVAVARSGGRDPFLRYGTAVLNVAGAVVGGLSISLVGGPPSWALTGLFSIAALLVLLGYREASGGEA